MSIILPVMISLIILGANESMAGPTATPSLKESASYSFAEPFVIDEEDIRNLREILNKRAQEICLQTRIIYNAQFLDNTSLETEDIEIILKEENRPPRKIQYISMKVQTAFNCPTEPRDFEIYDTPIIQIAASTRSFDHGLSYVVTGNSRDWVFLTRSDISKQMESMAISYGLPIWAWVTLVLLFVVITCFMCMFGLLRHIYYRYSTADSSSSHPVSIGTFMMLNQAFWPTFLIICFLVGFFGISFFNEHLGALWPTGAFLIGDEIKRNESIESFRLGASIFLATTYILPLIHRLFAKLIGSNKPKTLLV